ncbi:DEAD/DEAH box helicase [Curtobacterium sp. MWU13-2055]|uniref:DEAD/DEAH box helicase n=1 Tax=Curtobacterium sp. MWU13-2055 TaxID=2931928 RepID=UPI00201065CD|nr:DEAD/DEAH box helicase [Curtobacterium sp. MWU13-2055]
MAAFDLQAATRLLGLPTTYNPATSTNIRRMLRYADVLSQSESQRHRAEALRLVTHLVDHSARVRTQKKKLAAQIAATVEAVLLQLGNFPGLQTLSKSALPGSTLPIDRELHRAWKAERNRTRPGARVLTDAQWQIASQIRNSPRFSFSGPTSLGKSFLLRELIRDAVDAAKQDPLPTEQFTAIVLVPTVALISQVERDLRTELGEGVSVSSHPVIPRLIRENAEAVVLVLTPERMLRFLASDPLMLSHVFVDEAHRAVQDGDDRAPIYYQALTEALRRFQPVVGFSSPNVSNPEILGEVFGVETTSVQVVERAVLQRRMFVDLVEGNVQVFSGDGTVTQLQHGSVESAAEFIVRVAAGEKTIVYINSAAGAVEFARELAGLRAPVNTSQVTEMRTFLRESVHRDYYMRETVRHGVVFHHGVIPAEVRDRVEAIFSDSSSGVNFVVCTSTLLEGVNMPAKNIVVLHDTQGTSALKAFDFNNLIGRAGRLAQEFYGNVIALRDVKNRWNSGTVDLVGESKSEVLRNFLLEEGRRRAPFTDMQKVLEGERSSSWTQSRRITAQRYASVLAAEHIAGTPTLLSDKFIAKAANGEKTLAALVTRNNLPVDIIRSSPDILIEYQTAVADRIRTGDARARLIPIDADLSDLEVYYQLLRALGESYRWETEERQGRAPLIRGKSAEAVDANYWYWARVMRSWVLGDSVSQVIASSIAHHASTGKIWVRDYSAPSTFRVESFDRSSPEHLNVVIENTFRDLDGGLRHTVLRYAQNYHELSVAAVGVDEAGPNVALLVEYGSTNPLVVDLQQLGLSRTAALELARSDAELFVQGENGELIGVNAASFEVVADVSAEVLLEFWSVVGTLVGQQAEG